MASLITQVSTLMLPNPLILASGILDMARGTLLGMTDAGAIVTKSLGLEERKGHPNPTIVEVDHGLLNAMGLPNPGAREYIPEIKGLHKNQVIIGSIFGKNSGEFVAVAELLQDHVSALELNMSCPHVTGYGVDVTPAITEITRCVKDSVALPVFVKLGMENISCHAQAALKGGADGIVAINTLPGMAIDIETTLPILGNKVGGYSGPALKPIGVHCIYRLFQQVDVPLIGVGGIMTHEDVIQYLMAGASAVQIGTALYYTGGVLFSRICRDLSTWMDDHGYTTLRDLVAVSHKR